MNAWQSHEEVLDRNKRAMGARLGHVYTTLSNEVTWLHWQWHEYVQLFATKPTRVVLLNETAPFFFSMMQDAFWHEVLLSRSRIAGPPRSVGKDNLALEQLVPLISEAPLRAKVKDGIRALREDAAFARDWRNRHLAHRDLVLALGQRSKPLESATREQFDACLLQAAAILNLIDLRYLESTTAFNSGPMERGAVECLSVLRDGLRRRRETHEMLERGEYRPAMFNDDLDAI